MNLPEPPRGRCLLRITSTQLTPDEISEFLGLEPTQIHWLGTPERATNDVYRKHEWHLSSLLEECEVLDEQLKSLLLGVPFKKLAELTDMAGNEVEVRVYAEFGRSVPAFRLEPSLLRELALCGIALELEMYNTLEVFEDER